ncbi:MAG: NAD/NADP octopine/nopaline dehydrogenase family protein [Bacilli bacterium]
MNITIIGCGNIGSYLAVLFSKNINNKVFLYTKKTINKELYINYIEENKTFKSGLINISKNYKDCIRNSNLIFITYPSFMLEQCIIDISSYLKKGSVVIVIPGFGGSEFLHNYITSRGSIMIGLKRVPAIVRYDVLKNIVNVSSVKPEIFIASIPLKEAYNYKEVLKKLFKVKVTVLKNYAGISFTSSNPLLHTARLYDLFKEAQKEQIYNKKIRFYQKWTLNSSRLLIDLDKEMSLIVRKVTNNSYQIKTVLEHYEVDDDLSLTNKIKSIEAFKNIDAPFIKIDQNKYQIDWESRYFKEDFPYGLCIIKGYAILAKISTPTIDKIIKWYQTIIKKEYIINEFKLGKDYLETGMPQKYGIKSLKELENVFKNNR